jgi:hypothetical protein
VYTQELLATADCSDCPVPTEESGRGGGRYLHAVNARKMILGASQTARIHVYTVHISAALIKPLLRSGGKITVGHRFIVCTEESVRKFI